MGFWSVPRRAFEAKARELRIGRRDYDTCWRFFQSGVTMSNHQPVLRLNDINNTCQEGKLLIMAIAKITSEYEKTKTPDQVLSDLIRLSGEVNGKVDSKDW